jgi:hypothetical protein
MTFNQGEYMNIRERIRRLLQEAGELEKWHVPPRDRLPDNDQWMNRFEVKSESSNRIYIVAQNKKSGKWGCSCPAYLTRRKCKHLVDGLGLPTAQIHGYGQIGAGKGRE